MEFSRLHEQYIRKYESANSILQAGHIISLLKLLYFTTSFYFACFGGGMVGTLVSKSSSSAIFMNITCYTLQRTLKMCQSIHMWIVYHQYQCFTVYWDSSTNAGCMIIKNRSVGQGTLNLVQSLTLNQV